MTSTHSAGSDEEGGPKAGNMRSLSRAMEVFAELQRAERPQRLSDLARTYTPTAVNAPMPVSTDGATRMARSGVANSDSVVIVSFLRSVIIHFIE